MPDINKIIKHNIKITKAIPKCLHELKPHKIIFHKNHKIIYRQCRHCTKYVVCPDPQWIKYHGVSGKG